MLRRAWDTFDKGKKRKFVKLNRRMAEIGCFKFLYFPLFKEKLEKLTNKEKEAIRLKVEKKMISFFHPSMPVFPQKDFVYP